MSLSEDDIKYYAPLNNPTDDSSTLGGGINTSDELNGNSIGEIFPTRGADTDGGSDVVSYAKMFAKNTSATDDMESAQIYIANHLEQPGSDGVITLVSDSDNDDDSLYARIYIEQTDGSKTSEDITLDGTTQVSGTLPVKAGTNVKAEIRSVSGDALTAVEGNIAITRGTLLGYIPSGRKTAQGNYAIGLESSLDDTATTTNRLTAPSGITFYQPGTRNAALDVANGGTLSAGSAQGIWVKQTLYDGEIDTPDMEIDIRIFRP